MLETALRLPSLLLVGAALGGCYFGGEAGYTNAYTLRDSGGASLALRGGLAELPNRGTALVALDGAVRFEATDTRTRVSLGPSLLLAPADSIDREITPFARPGAWLAVGRWRDARQDFWLTPSLDLGFMLPRKSDSYAGAWQLYQAGLRTEYLGRENDTTRSFAATLYLAFGIHEPFGQQ